MRHGASCDELNQMSAVVIAGGPGARSDGIEQETAMISALGQPLIDFVLDALGG